MDLGRLKPMNKMHTSAACFPRGHAGKTAGQQPLQQAGKVGMFSLEPDPNFGGDSDVQLSMRDFPGEPIIALEDFSEN